MNRCYFCEWIPILPWPVWPLAGHARLGQNTVVGSMTILLSWLCWGACQEEVCLDPRFLCNLTLPRFSVELPPGSCPRANPRYFRFAVDILAAKCKRCQEHSCRRGETLFAGAGGFVLYPDWGKVSKTAT